MPSLVSSLHVTLPSTPINELDWVLKHHKPGVCEAHMWISVQFPLLKATCRLFYQEVEVSQRYCSMQGHDFSTTDKAIRSTSIMEGSIRGLCTSDTGSKRKLEEVESGTNDIFEGYIWGKLETRNPAVKEAGAEKAPAPIVVQQLAVRKKVKKS